MLVVERWALLTAAQLPFQWILRVVLKRWPKYSNDAMRSSNSWQPLLPSTLRVQPHLVLQATVRTVISYQSCLSQRCRRHRHRRRQAQCQRTQRLCRDGGKLSLNRIGVDFNQRGCRRACSLDTVRIRLGCALSKKHAFVTLIPCAPTSFFACGIWAGIRAPLCPPTRATKFWA